MYYRCDPRKNIMCKKRNCYVTDGTCTLTSDMDCSIDGKMLLTDTAGKYITVEQQKAKEEFLNGQGICGE